MNVEKLKRLQTQVRIGGKGTARRKKKVMHQTATTDDKKLQSSLKKLSVSTIPGIEEVNIIKDDLTVIHFNNPKAQASLSANTFAVTGHGETKKIVEMLPEILPQLGQETVVQLRMFANSMAGTKKGSGTASGGDTSVGTNILYSVEEEDDVPMLVSDFDEVAKLEAAKATITPTTKTSNSEQPKSEQDNDKKNAEIKETIEVLPSLSEENSNTETINAVTKVNELKSLENLNLNIKLNEESEQNNDKLKSANNDKESRNDQIDLNQESVSTNKKELPTKDEKKLNEPQKINENKQQSGKQRNKTEPKSQKNLKDTNKSEKSDNEKVAKKEEQQETVLKSAGVDVKSEKSPQEEQKPLEKKQSQKQLKTEQVSEKQQKKEKQQQQSEPKQELDQPKNVDIKENQNKLEQPQSQKTNQIVQGQVCDQKKQPNKQENQKQQTPSPKPTQQQQQQKQQQQQIKQKNKSSQQKGQNQDPQHKTDNEERVEKTEKKPQASKPLTVKQQEKSSDKGSIEQKKEPKQPTAEKQTTETTDTQVKGSQQEKKSTTSKQDAPAKDNESNQHTLTAQKEKQQHIPQGQQLERQTDASVNKDNFPVVGPEKQTETKTPIADVSIKTIALQSLESTEKLLEIVSGITKELTVEGLKEDKKAELPSEKQLEVPEKKECATVQAVEPTVQLPLASQNIVTNEEIKLNIVGGLADTVEKVSSEEKLEISEKPTSVSNAEAAKEVVKENKNESVPEKVLTNEPSHPSPPPTPEKTPAEQLDKKPTLAEIVQSQSATSTLIKDEPTGEEKTESHPPISTDQLSKQLTLVEVVQAVPTQIPANIIDIEKVALTDERKDNPSAELLVNEDVKDAKSDSSAPKEDPKLIVHSEASEVNVITPETLPTTPENKKNTTPTAAGNAKPKVSPPKQTKTPQDLVKQQAKVSSVKEAQKTSAPADAKLKLATKPQPAQQQHSSKGNAKTTSSSKSIPATPTTPTTPTTPITPTTPLKMSPEKCVQQQKSTAPNTKAEGTSKKTNPPQKQVDAAKPKQQQGAAGKTVRPGSGNVSAPSGGSKKGNTAPPANKTSVTAGKKQQETSPLQNTTIASSIGTAQPEATLPPSAAPATENTANSIQSPPST